MYAGDRQSVNGRCRQALDDVAERAGRMELDEAPEENPRSPTTPRTGPAGDGPASTGRKRRATPRSQPVSTPAGAESGSVPGRALFTQSAVSYPAPCCDVLLNRAAQTLSLVC